MTTNEREHFGKYHQLLLSEIQLHTRVLNLNEKLNDNPFAGGVGFSVSILKEEIQQDIFSFKLDLRNTVFQAELAALGEAATWAVKTINKINIFTDSRSSIDALKSHRTKSKFDKRKIPLGGGIVGTRLGEISCRDPRS
ncbi:hypothetical protein AVEN_236263-1 [Araneus ventricosus]|uniref:RNase H type-1 domain-containing protein n=1 Tax=Araneus ventricosus TaxID=182803 RepID=A0A4Y2UQP7_ARAVE|nr:hypothetical protein AVEN_236263-1 [Araneus ventricosus]